MLRFRPGSSLGTGAGRAASQQPYQSRERAPHGPRPPRDGWRGHRPQEYLVTQRAAQYRLAARGRPTQVSRRQVGTRLQVRAWG